MWASNPKLFLLKSKADGICFLQPKWHPQVLTPSVRVSDCNALSDDQMERFTRANSGSPPVLVCKLAAAVSHAGVSLCGEKKKVGVRNEELTDISGNNTVEGRRNWGVTEASLLNTRCRFR